MGVLNPMTWLRAGGGAVKAGWGMLPGGVKTVLGFGGAGLGLAGAYDVVANGGSNLKGAASAPVEAAAEISANGGVQQTKSTFWGMIGFLAEILKAIGVKGGIPETLMGVANRGNALGGGNPIQNEGRWNADNAQFGGSAPGGTTPGGATPGGTPTGGAGGGNDNDDGSGSGWGTTALVGTAGAATLVGGAYGVNRYRNSRRPGLGGVPGGAAEMTSYEARLAEQSSRAARTAAGGADDAVRAAAGGADDAVRAVSRMGRWGKIASVIGGTGLGLWAMSPDEAQAATLPTAGATRSNLTAAGAGAGSVGIGMPEVAGMGMSIVGGKVAAETVAGVAAPALARLGFGTVAKAIPGIASIYAAGETVYNVGSDLLRGDFKKAGLNLVSGIGETVAGLGGALTYFTVGTAWREAVRAGGAAAFGEEGTIDHSAVVQAGSFLKDAFFGASNNTESAPAPQRLAPRAGGPALAF